MTRRNIRDHFRLFVKDGGPGRIEVQNGIPGALFTDEFTAFCNLGYNSQLGYYRLSMFPDEENECDSSNPETIHPYTAPDDWQGYVWMDESGIPHILGERHQVADLYCALHDFLMHGIYEADDPVGDDDPVWGGPYSIDQAAERAHAFDPERFPKKWLTQRIRQACQSYRIEGVWKTPSGRWKIPQIEFEHWLNDASAHRSGPRVRGK